MPSTLAWQLRALAEGVDISIIRGTEIQNVNKRSICMSVKLHTNLSRGKAWSAKEASMRKQAGCRNTGIHHVGLPATNPAASAEFYRDVLGMEIVGGTTPDHPLGAAALLSSRPDEESHEIALFANPVFAHIAFKVSSLAEFRSFNARVVEKNIPIKFVFNHG